MDFKGVVKNVLKTPYTTKEGVSSERVEIGVEEENDRFPEKVLLSIDTRRITDIPSEGDKVEVSFNHSYREWDGKLFGENRCWRLKITERKQSAF